MAFERKGNKAAEIGPMPGVTAETYEEMSHEFARGKNACFMIMGDMHREQSVWRHYFHKKGLGKRVKQMNWWFENKGQYAVPAHWPWEFDRSVYEGDFR